MANEFKVDKSLLIDPMGRPRSQSLFLELGYNPEAIFTLSDNDKEYKGKIYVSLKRLYIEAEDPLEIHFANKYFTGWYQWMKITNNKLIEPYVTKWRDELELMIRSTAVKNIIEMATDDKGGFQASKWLADKGWIARDPGRPSNEEVEKELGKQASIRSEFQEDFDRLGKLH